MGGSHPVPVLCFSDSSVYVVCLVSAKTTKVVAMDHIPLGRTQVGIVQVGACIHIDHAFG